MHVCFVFELEFVVFACLNLLDFEYTHWIFRFSYLYSIFNLILMMVSIPLMFFIINRPKSVLNSKAFKHKFGVLYHEFKIDESKSRFFYVFKCIKNLMIGAIIVFFYNMPLLQVFSVFLANFLYLSQIVRQMPFKYKLVLLIEASKEALFSLGSFLFLLLCLDDHYTMMKIESRKRVGWIIIFVFASALVVSLVYILGSVIRYSFKMYNNGFSFGAKK